MKLLTDSAETTLLGKLFHIQTAWLVQATNPFSRTFQGHEKWKKFSRAFKDFQVRVVMLYTLLTLLLLLLLLVVASIYEGRSKSFEPYPFKRKVDK